tara:strand:+ start:2858 stop:5080 length:2223 start_codon:yes stop_codon:yes gene_type:complete
MAEEDVNKAAKETTNAAIGMAKSLGLTKPSLTDFASNIKFAGGAAGAVAKEIEKQVSQYQVLTKSGVHFGGSLESMLTAATGAGLSIKEMTGLVASNSELLAGFGGTVEHGATLFLSNMKQLNSENNRFGTQLRNIGLTHEEIGEAMMMTQRMAMMSGKQNAASDALIQQRTAEYAKDLDLLSKLTGKSNDALKKEQAALQRQGDFRAKTMGMEANMQKAMMNAASEADASGIGDLFKDMMIRGFPSEDQAQLAGMFSNSMGIMKQMKAAQDAGRTEEYNALKSQLAAAAAKDRSANKELAILGGTNSATAAVAESYAKTSEAMIGVQAQYERGEITLSQMQGQFQEMRKKALSEQIKQGGFVDKGGAISEDPEQMVLQSALRGQEAMIRAATKVQADVTKQVYQEFMGPLFKDLTQRAMSPDFNLIDPVTDTIMKPLQAAKDYITTGEAPPVDPGVLEGVKTDIDAKLIAGTTQENTNELVKLKTEIETLSKVTSLSREETIKLINALNAANAIVNPSADRIPVPPAKSEVNPLDVNTNQNLKKRMFGTPGMDQAMKGFTSFASLTENFGKGTLAILHGNELVMTQAQAKQLDAGIAAMKSAGGLGGAESASNVAMSMESMVRGYPTPEDLDRSRAISSNANIQGAVNTMRSPETQANAGPSIETSITQLREAMETFGTGNVEAIKAVLDPEVFKGMKDAMEQTASGIGSQLVEQKNMTKVTKNLGAMGNVFSRGGLNI